MNPTVQGILGNQSDLQNLAGNPLFNIGMGLLQSHYDPRINPFSAVLGGLKSAGAEQRTAEDRRREQTAMEQIAEYLKQQQQPQQPQSAVQTMLSPSVQRGLMANALDPQNQQLYNRLAWQEILGGM